MTQYYIHPFTGKKIKLGGVKTKKCIRCHEYFFPNTARQKHCPYCLGKPIVKGRPMYVKFCRLLNCQLERVPGEGAKSLCKKHYNILIKNPADARRKKMKAAEKWEKVGVQTCRMFEECEVFFFPKGRNQYGTQKFCPSCAQKRSWDKTKKTEGVNH